MPQFIAKSQNITIPKFFIDVLMPNANATFVKVYLYAFMLASDNMSIDNITIANKLGILESDVVGAFSYWQSQGVLTVSDGFVEFLPVPSAPGHSSAPIPAANYAKPIQSIQNVNPVQAQAVQPVQPTKPTVSKPKKYDSAEVAKAISENEVLSELALVAQTMLGKPLNTQDTVTLYSFYDELGFQPEIILLLLEHCVSKGKTNMKYIEKTAIAWHEAKLFTAEAVTQYLENAKEKSTYMYNVRRKLGLTDRKITSREENYIKKWQSEYQMSEDMVSLAYEYCVMQINKLSFQYIDKILERWHNQNITTVAAAQKDSEDFKSRNNNQQNVQPSNYNSSQSGYDYQAIEQKMWENIKKS